MMTLVIPTVNLNGTTREELIEQQRDVLDHLTMLLEAMAKASPHGRDYQLAPDTYAYARDAWNVRRKIIEDLRTEITSHAIAINQQGARR